MSRRLTKEELDAQFEQFLKESVSDESVDLGGPAKQPHVRSRQKPKQKPAASWWQDDDHSSDGTGGESPKQRFIKAKKFQPEINKVISTEPIQKPVPTPRSKALGKPLQTGTSPKAPALGFSQSVTSHSASGSGGLSSPTQENPHSLSGERSSDGANDTPPASSDGDSDNGSRTSFRKPLKTSQPIREENEDPGDSRLRDDGLEAALLSRSGSETDGLALAPTANMSREGFDTLDEEDEKARFFAQLEGGASSTIDYAKLNRELDSTSSTIITELRKAEEAAVEPRDDDQSKARDTETVNQSPACTDSPHYSEDFEDEDNMKEKPKISPILAKVSLYDSLDDTGEEDRRKESLDRGQSHVQSGGSEMEALQEAYRQIQTVQNSDDPVVSLESGVRVSRAASPSSHPQPAQLSLQPASTTESDLPTAEELMRPIRPENEQLRGFTLQPVRAAELNQGKVSRPLERTFPIQTHTESEWKASTAGLSHPPSCSEEGLNRDLKWSIRQEVERLMQDENNYSTQTSSHASKAKTQPGSRSSSALHPSERRPAVAPRRGRTADERPALRSRPSGPRGTPTVSRHDPQRNKPKNISEVDGRLSTESGGKASSELVASVQSLVAVLQQQMDSSSHRDAAHRGTRGQDSGPAPHTALGRDEDDSAAVELLKVQLAQKEKELQMAKGAAEELNLLKQQNFLLQSKLRSAEEASEKKKWQEAADAVTDDKLKQIDKEIKQQETLIKGYQQENEKLYLQMKAQQAKSKANEEAMFKENQRLLNELASTREQLSKTPRPVSSSCVMDPSQRISELLAQIDALQRNEAKLSEGNLRLRQEKQSLEVDLQLMKKERDLAKAQAISISGDKSFEVRVLEDKHREEVAALKKKLQWFAENQELLDRDAGRLKKATAEIHQLKEQVENLKQEVGKRSSEQRKTRDKSVEAKRIQDLERQVKELEQILRSRNPNSLPALIYAAAAHEHGDQGGASGTSPVNTLLERRVLRLEAELDSHDADAKRSLRAMEQQFHRIKLRYEQRIAELEQQLEPKQQADRTAGSEQWMAKCQTLEEELLRVKESHQRKEKCLQEQIESLQQQLKNKQAQPSPGRHQRHAEAASAARMERLTQELATKTRSIQELSRTVDRLQRERRSLLSAPLPRPEVQRQPADPPRTQRPLSEAQAPAGGEAFPDAQYEKTYQPTAFTETHISEVLQENQALQERLEQVQLRAEQEQGALTADREQAREELSRLKEQWAQQRSSREAEHRGALERLRAAHALEHASSRAAEQANQLHSQQIAIRHLQEQLKELKGCKEALQVSRSREDALQTQLTRLLQELKEAKDAQSSEVKLLCGLERKILNMELRHQSREKELQQVIGGTLHLSGSDLQAEVERWRRLAQDKSRELEAFRLELDSILDILRHLQRQGVVLASPEQKIPAALLQRC
ncbi:centrosomal protein of 162 kDa isoform 2-T2 [Menidia menidia]